MDARPLHEARTTEVATRQATWHKAIVDEVRQAVASEPVVVIGMAWNPNCSKARKNLDKKGVKHVYLEYGNYLSKWKERLAIKLWSGWPTYPQVFVKGTLVGGNTDLEALIASGEFDKLLA